MMRKARDGESTREIVIAAAKEAFAENGFAGTSLAMITQRCGISDGLILYHFKSKQNLYDVVLNNLAKEYLAVITQSGDQPIHTPAAAEDLLRDTFQYWSEDSFYHRISLWAFLENQNQLIKDEAKITAGLAAAIQQMQADGQVDAKYSPVVLLTMVIGPIHFWVRYRQIFKETLKLTDSIESLNHDYLEQYLNLIQKIFLPTKMDL